MSLTSFDASVVHSSMRRSRSRGAGIPRLDLIDSTDGLGTARAGAPASPGEPDAGKGETPMGGPVARTWFTILGENSPLPELSRSGFQRPLGRAPPDRQRVAPHAAAGPADGSPRLRSPQGPASWARTKLTRETGARLSKSIHPTDGSDIQRYRVPTRFQSRLPPE